MITKCPGEGLFEGLGCRYVMNTIINLYYM